MSIKTKKKKGHLVLNHSTHISGLIPLLERLIEIPEIKKVTPGRLAQVKGRPSRLKIKVTVPIMGGHKLQARSSGSVQEIFVTTHLDAETLQTKVNQLIAN